MDIYFIAVQAVGFLAFGLSLLSYQFKNQKTMFAIRVCGDFLWAFHYFLLSALTPAITVGIAALRTLLTVFFIPQYRVAIIITAICIVWALCYLNANGQWGNYLPATTAIIFGLSNYYHEDYWKSRLLMLLGLFIWICVGVVFGSYAEIVSSSVSVLSLLLGFYRHKKTGQG